jgi:hypothetical protein
MIIRVPPDFLSDWFAFICSAVPARLQAKGQAKPGPNRPGQARPPTTAQ